ncbi:MAG: GAF domain-containing protein [Desulfomonile tiedjei]|nr:GAF domain-containing protein [Desulfomonile tiedjei]
MAINTETGSLYQDRFENLMRVAEKITASLNIGDVLEAIRDEVKNTIPHAKEACLILTDTEAPTYTRPLHCCVKKEQVNCHNCKRAKDIVSKALVGPAAFQCILQADGGDPSGGTEREQEIYEIVLPIYDGGEPLGVLNVVTDQGQTITERDMVLLQDLTNLATNTIVNAKKYAKISREKLTLERIMGHISPFLPETVKRIVEKNPEAPAFDKRESDISILFLDVADYTRITESVTRDQVNFIIEKYFSSFLDVIYSHGGDVNETAGDGLMAIFQGTVDDHPLRAANAALDIRRRTGEINEELAGLFYPIAVNMGINSGTASVGMSRFTGTSGTRMTFTASGSVTNLASRLAASAQDGEILVGPETAHRISDKMTLFSKGSMRFKNIRETVQIHSLVPPVHLI